MFHASEAELPWVLQRNCLTEGAGSTPTSWFSLPLSLLPPSLKSSQTVVLMDVWALDADIHQLRQSDSAEFAPPVSLDPFRGGEASLNTGSGEWEYKCNIKQLQNIAKFLLSSWSVANCSQRDGLCIPIGSLFTATFSLGHSTLLVVARLQPCEVKISPKWGRRTFSSAVLGKFCGILLPLSGINKL